MVELLELIKPIHIHTHGLVIGLVIHGFGAGAGSPDYKPIYEIHERKMDGIELEGVPQS